MSPSRHDQRLTAAKIGARLELVAPMVHRRRQPLPAFRIHEHAGTTLHPEPSADAQTWQEIPHESYWGRADLDFTLNSTVDVPAGWNNAQLALHLPLGIIGDIFNHPEALVLLDGHPIGSSDRYHHTLPLDPATADGRPHDLTLHGWTGHAGWPPDPQSRTRLFMGTCALVERDPATQQFVDLARAALDTVSVLPRDACERTALLDALDAAFLALDTRDPVGDAFYASVPAALDQLRSGIEAAGSPLDVTLHAIGHAHMDIAYLWPIAQIRLKNARTYSNVLRLMDTDPEFRFSHSQPALYEMTQSDHPEIFERIRARVAEGRWEVMGGMWVEPDLNIPGPEALVRQLTLGRGWFRDAFGAVETPALWLPDTFGFPAQIPQLMRLAGLRWFVTNKLNWNQVNRVPWPSHHWEGLDGSRVLAHILTTPRPVQYLPFPTNYKSDLSAREVAGTWTHALNSPLRALPICFGYGDGGGGPTEDLLAKARAYRAMPGMPRVQLSTVRDAMEAIEAQSDDLPVWKGEHYLEGHRGVFTSQGWIKRANRKAERALHEAEALMAMAGLSFDLTEAWKLLCLNQFHDIVTGTSVACVFEDARRDFARIRAMTEDVARKAASALGSSKAIVLNTAPVAGPRLVERAAHEGNPSQATANGGLFFFPQLAAYSATPLSQAEMPAEPVSAARDGTGAILENAVLRVRVAANGQIVSMRDKTENRDVLADGKPGNQLLAFEDRPICWDAWDIDPSYEDRQDSISKPGSLEIVENGPLRAAVRITHAWQSSRIVQTITLAAHSRRLDFRTEVDWNETHTLLKTAFPVNVAAPHARFDIQWGAVERATTRDTAFDAARFEVTAQKWAELSDGAYAVALLNDCKYGYDVRDNVLRLTLIKSSTSPDPNVDQGAHAFTYALLANPGADRRRLDQAAYDLNTPLRIAEPGQDRRARPGSFVSCDTDNVLIETLKPADTGQGVVLRLFESEGLASTCVLSCARPVAAASVVDLFEVPLEELDPEGRHLTIAIAPFQILSIAIEFADSNSDQDETGTQS